MNLAGEAAPADCDVAPIHAPGSIQPWGALLVLRASDLRCVAASSNIVHFLHRAAPVGSAPEKLLPHAAMALRTWQQAGATGLFTHLGDWLDLCAQRVGTEILLELEPAPLTSAAELFGGLVSDAAGLRTAASVEATCQDIACQMRRLTGHDRVLVYRFAEDWSGQVIAEDRCAALPSYLDLHFPAGDIPPPARALYLTMPLRLIADVAAEPVAVLPAGQARDLGGSLLRAVAPVHLAYLRNMGVRAAMSVPIICGGQLWGLVACHAVRPLHLARPLRAACAFLGQLLALHVAAHQQATDSADHLARQALLGRLLAALTEDDRAGPLDLVLYPQELLALTGAGGAAVLHQGNCLLAGTTPPEAAVRRIADALPGQSTGARREPVATHRLVDLLSDAEDCIAPASGVLSVTLSSRAGSRVMWFRPEQPRTVSWGGDPTRLLVPGGASGALQPRASFAAWSETVRHTAAPWSAVDRAMARELGEAMVVLMLSRAEALAELCDELARANRELEAFSYSVSHDLRAPFRHIVGYAELLREQEQGRLDETALRYVRTIIEAGLSAGRLVDDLLTFAHLGRAGLVRTLVDVGRLAQETRHALELEFAERRIEWHIGPLPPAWGDGAMLRQVMLNLVANAVKYTAGRNPARIQIAGEQDARETRYLVRDNGVGFDMAYAGKLFGVFQRLHRAEDYEGSGIGLALARRIVERHGGRIWADARLDQGASFWFALPRAKAGGAAG